MSAADWPAIATGIVGVVGIGATYFQNKAARKTASDDLKKNIDATARNLAASISAEDGRALQAEKRRVYSEFQGSLDNVFVAAVHLHDGTTGEFDLSNALTAMYRATAAVKLIASEPLGELANATARAMADETGTARVGTAVFDRDNKIYNNRQELYRLMREDMGVDEFPEQAGSSTVVPQEDEPLPQADDIDRVASSPEKHVDPAALIIAVVVVAAEPLLRSGLWSYLNTVVAGIALVIVTAYSVTRTNRQSLTKPQLIAISLVVGLIFSIGAAYPIQELIIAAGWHSGDDNFISNAATALGFAAGALATVTLLVWLLWQRLEPKKRERWEQRWNGIKWLGRRKVAVKP